MERAAYILYVDDDWRMEYCFAQWDAGANALTLAAISCVLYSAVAAPFKSLSLLMRTLVLLSLFSFVVKFGLMVQISDLWQFLLFLFPLLATMQLLKLADAKICRTVGATDCFYGFVYRCH
ncbi:FUSC family protein [Escherichia coli]